MVFQFKGHIVMTASSNKRYLTPVGTDRRGPTVTLSSTLCAILALFSPWATYTQVAPLMTPVTLIVALMTAYMILRFLKKPVLFFSRQDMYLILYLFLVTSSYFWTQNTENWGNFVFWWYVCVATYFAARSALRTAEDFRLVVFSFFLGILITAFNLELSFNEWGNSSMRYSVAGHNSNFTAYVLSGGLFLFLATWSHLGATRSMFFLLPIWIGLTLYCQIQLGTRGAILSSALTISLFSIRRYIPRFGLQTIIYSLLLIGFSISAGLTQFALSFFDSFIDGRGTGNLSDRGLIWAEAYIHAIEHPILGIGPGSFAAISELRAGAHNLLLTIQLEGGLVGVTLFGGFLLLFLRGIFAKAPTHRRGLVLIALFLCYWLPIVSSGHWELAPFSWLLLALFGRLVSIENDGNSVRFRVVAPVK